MATTAKTLFRGAASTTVSTLLYTVPASTTTVISSVAVTNTTSTARTFTLTLDDIDLHTTADIAAFQTVYIDLKQTLTAAKTIKGGASATTVNFHICGVEIA